MRTHVLAPVLVGAAVSAALVVGIGLGAREATSDPVEPGAAPAPAATGAVAHAPFTAYAADEGALTFEQLDAAEQAAIVAQRNRDSSAALEARFEMMRAITIARGERTHAEISASMIGLEGLGTEGVVP